MSGEADMRERIKEALARYETSGKAKRGKRKSVKLFSVDRHEPRRGTGDQGGVRHGGEA